MDYSFAKIDKNDFTTKFLPYIKDNDIDQDISKHYITRLFKVIIATKIIN